MLNILFAVLPLISVLIGAYLDIVCGIKKPIIFWWLGIAAGVALTLCLML